MNLCKHLTNFWLGSFKNYNNNFQHSHITLNKAAHLYEYIIWFILIIKLQLHVNTNHTQSVRFIDVHRHIFRIHSHTSKIIIDRTKDASFSRHHPPNIFVHTNKKSCNYRSNKTRKQVCCTLVMRPDDPFRARSRSTHRTTTAINATHIIKSSSFPPLPTKVLITPLYTIRT